ncbi:MAG: hypothetical protein HZA50_14430 [Planctomycetes bacterium]|nr:hypothetical protein [Planctomycetota bacterium]
MRYNRNTIVLKHLFTYTIGTVVAGYMMIAFGIVLIDDLTARHFKINAGHVLTYFFVLWSFISWVGCWWPSAGVCKYLVKANMYILFISFFGPIIKGVYLYYKNDSFREIMPTFFCIFLAYIYWRLNHVHYGTLLETAREKERLSEEIPEDDTQ